jgi:hypothetical protein
MLGAELAGAVVWAGVVWTGAVWAGVELAGVVVAGVVVCDGVDWAGVVCVCVVRGAGVCVVAPPVDAVAARADGVRRAENALRERVRAVASLSAGWALGADTGRLASVCPWKPLAASTARAPDRATTAATIPRVIALIRRNPASRALIARRAAASAGLRSECRCRRPLNGGVPERRGVRRWRWSPSCSIVGSLSQILLSHA